MTNKSRFPQVKPYGPWLSIAGSFRYQPWVRFDEKIMDKLESIVEHYYSPDGCENPDVLLDFRECECNEQGIIIHRSEIILYRDGGDWCEEEEGHWSDIGIIFARRDIDQTTDPSTITYRVHLPPAEIQDKLLPVVGDVIDGLQAGDTKPLQMVQEYLSSVIGDESKWRDLSAFPDPEQEYPEM